MTRRNVLLLLVVLVVAALAGTVALRRTHAPAPVSDVPPIITGASAPGGANPASAPVGSLTASGESASGAPVVPKASPGGYWSRLTASQQEALAPLAQDWNRMNERQREKWIEIAKRFHTLSPESRKRLHDRMADWVRLTPEQRKLARESYQNAKTLPPGRKAQMWQQYQQLTEEQKKRLAADDRKQASRPNVVSAPPSGRPGVKNPYAAVHRKDAGTSGRNGVLPPAVASGAAAAPTGQPMGTSAAPSAAATPASAGTANSDENGDAVFNSEIYHHN
ncbi:DUF3106 domain-containing protein [Pandoraea terrigena]|uniref:Putative transmembrane protein n=1 Tax=Pandoraea terrigena TaxID=2508292 RepID=A0A5E4UND7_9BURK|nr:DUF3106 domain-containing protein [Pandoraea terrigena]VVE00599.1 putative transmembrane protein [Pandoraea terrigena]